MRVATVVLGFALAITGEATLAFESTTNPDGSVATLAAPTERFITRSTNAWLNAQHSEGGRSALGAMGLVSPSHNPLSFTRVQPPLHADERPRERYNPATTPLPATRTLEDHLLTGFVALMLIAYQLRRKHRFLRPHQFST